MFEACKRRRDSLHNGVDVGKGSRESMVPRNCNLRGKEIPLIFVLFDIDIEMPLTTVCSYIRSGCQLGKDRL